MKRGFYGERYLQYLKAGERYAPDFIINTLPFLDFDQVITFYHDSLTKEHPWLRALFGLNDRFYLLTSLLRRPDALHQWLFARCREVEEAPDGHLDLWARYHYKSSIITFAGIIQEILRDPEITIGIFSHTKEIARAFLDQIKTELEQNEVLKDLYEDVLFREPTREANRWSKDDGIIVKRRSNPKEGTVEAWGLVDGMPTGRHYGLIVYDDIVTDKSITTPEIIKKTTIAWENSDNLAKAEGVRKWHAGTRWSFGDTYGVIMERGALIPRIYPATDDGSLNGNPVFLTPARWADVKRTQRSTVSAQMLLNPVSGADAVFKSEWFTHYDVIPANMNVYIMCDPSKGRSKSSDRTAIAVIGVDTGRNKYLLDGYRHRMRLRQRYEYLRQLYLKWTNFPGVQSVKVGYEIYGAQADDEVIQEYQQRDGVYFALEELKYPRQGPHSKFARVERLQPDMESGRFYMPAVVWHPGIDKEARATTCLWDAWTEEKQQQAETQKLDIHHHVGQVLYRPMQDLTRMQKWVTRTGESHRVVKALRRIDEDGDLYDLTRAFMEEVRLFPFAPHDDLIDATSRIYDMEVTPPVHYEASATSGSAEDELPGSDGEDGLMAELYDA